MKNDPPDQLLADVLAPSSSFMERFQSADHHLVLLIVRCRCLFSVLHINLSPYLAMIDGKDGEESVK